LEDPDLIGTVGLLEATLDEATERSNTDTSANQEHRTIRVELFSQRVGHQTFEHGNEDLRGTFTGSLSSHELVSLSLKESRANASAAATSPIHRVVDCDGNLDQASLSMFAESIRFRRVVGERVESWHQLSLDGQELVHGRMRAGERVEDL
jgi:hypothetical protein